MDFILEAAEKPIIGHFKTDERHNQMRVSESLLVVTWCGGCAGMPGFWERSQRAIATVLARHCESHGHRHEEGTEVRFSRD